MQVFFFSHLFLKQPVLNVALHLPGLHKTESESKFQTVPAESGAVSGTNGAKNKYINKKRALVLRLNLSLV